MLAYRHHRDKGFPFAPGTEGGGLAYSWWLMRFGHRKFKDNALNVFGGNAGVMGWITDKRLESRSRFIDRLASVKV